MFLDEVELELSGGRGGAGSNSLRREKYVPKGGPDGGDGGQGGDVILVADPSESSLQRYQLERRFRGRPGGAGEASRRHGADGPASQLAVPCGTLVFELPSGRQLADLSAPGERLVAAPGGKGGRGNTHFATPTLRTPRRRELGEPGRSVRVRLELRLIADLGLVGLPNAGKSSLLSRLTGARPKVASYPFTTLSPNLGVAETEGGVAITVADVPGLIAGAHRGAGLGIGFLRHLERTRGLIHVVDISSGGGAAVAAYREVEAELASRGPGLSAKPRLVAANKVDLVGPRELELALAALSRAAPAGGRPLTVSALTGEGVSQLLGAAFAMLGAAPRPAPERGEFRLYQGPRPRRRELSVERREGRFLVVGGGLERLVAVSDLDDPDSVLRLQRRLKRLGVEAALARAGAQGGDVVEIAGREFTFVPDPPQEPG